jgi:threonine dehydratase
VNALNRDSIRAAARLIDGLVHHTPVFTCRTLDLISGRRLFFKCENLQKVGAFKFRGASHFVMKLTDLTASKGVVTHSSGNHAQAVALAARIRGIRSSIVMPSNAAPVKRRAVEGYGGRVIECDPTLEAREVTAARILEETGATFIPPYDHPDIIAGQGTVALELIDQVKGLDAVIAPVGGGGLVAGICIALEGLSPPIRIVAAEPSGADDAARSLKAGVLIPQSDPRTIADGLLTSLGTHTWPIIMKHVERIITVEDEQIIESMKLVWERMKLLIEPSAAVAVAAVNSKEFREIEEIERVGVILSGGNADLDHLPW